MAKDKKARRKAEKLRRKAWGSAIGPNPKPIHIEPGGLTINYAPGTSPSELIGKVEQALLHENDPQPRFERKSDLGGKPSIFDNLTGFYAVYSDHVIDALEEDLANLNSGEQVIDNLYWRHRSGATVMKVKAQFENEFFWTLLSDEGGYAVYDRHTGKVHPIAAADDEQALAVSKEFNFDPERMFSDCLTADHSVHFIGWREWLHPEPEDESLLDSELARALDPEGHVVDPFAVTEEPPKPERTNMYAYIDESDEDYGERLKAALSELSPEYLASLGYSAFLPAPAATETPDRKPLRILVAGSSAWRWMGLVGEMIQDRWNSEGNPPLVIQTSGSPYGAEAAAQKLAEQVADVTHVTIDDMNVNRETTDFAFVFQTDESRQIDQLLSRLIEQKVPYHSVRERRPDDRWRAR